MKKVGVAILGFGDVGVATYQTLVNHREFYLKTQRVDLTVEMVYDKSAECLTAQGIPEENHANSIEEVIANPLVDIVVETMGGVDVARTFVSAALREGKTVVTCNKELILRTFEGKSVSEIAQELSLSPKTVETQIYRTKLALKEHLSKLLYIAIILTFNL